jgi:glyoxylase-like metal-dependent hydrolase (beta-lactamase superfamily II)
MKNRSRPLARRPPPAPAPRPEGGIDLHVHSLYSDGTDRPAALAGAAKAAGLGVISLADHDSVRGIPEAREACRAAGVLFVPGIELSVGLGEDEIHILGYGIDARGRSLQRALDLVAGERVERMERMVGALGKAGVPITVEQVREIAGGDIFYDTGYNTRFYNATRQWPFRLMRILTPARITPDDNINVQLEKLDIPPEKIRTVILGHGHMDHVPGVRHFPDAEFILESGEWSAMNAPGRDALRHGYIPSLYRDTLKHPNCIELSSDGVPYGPFEKSRDLLGDGTLILIHLPGHTRGQMGLLLTLDSGRRIFFIGDACWISESFETCTPPSSLIRLFVDSHSRFLDTLSRLHTFHKENPDVLIVPSHCPDAYRQLKDLGLA